MAAIKLNIAGDTRQLDRDIQKTVNRVYSINLKTKGEQPLGRITGKVNEFEKSLAASNARVIAFGASAGIIYGVQSAFVSLAKSVVDVQKSLQDINVILNVSTSQLNKFGSDLFSIAKNTGQSFKEVANAATEFSRQGLGLEETLKRTNEALILSRLSGLDTVKSVEALTAAVNSFASQAVTATQIVNKFATVDAAFAVSSADLAEAIARVGSSAAQSGINLDELIAIVTSAQQTTARGGAVIGNSFKTIFTRLQREKVVDLLESLGISSTDSSGQLKSTIQLLQDLGSVYDQLGSQQQAYVAEQVGGVFQINILKAALADLGKEYSIYNNALRISATATDQAIQRNEQLNKTFAAQLNALQQNVTQFGGAIGERLLTPLFDRTVGNLNELLGGINEGDANGFGATLGKGILDGLGQVLAGPGLALIGGVLIKLFKDFSVYAAGSLKDILGLNTASKQQAELQKSISQIISKNPELYALMQKGATGLNQASQILLQNLKAQTLELQTQQKLSAVIAKQFYGAGVRVSGGVPTAPTGKPGKAAGFIPNFASDKLVEKYTAISLGATSSVRPHMSQGTIGGKKFVMNNQEVEFPGVGKNGDSMVLPKYGDGPRIAAAGFIPNFAQTGSKKRISKETRQRSELFRKYGYLVPPGVGNGFLSGLGNEFPDNAIRVREPKLQNIDSNSNELKLEKNISNKITDDAVAFTNTLKPLGRTVNRTEIEKAFQTTAGAKGAISGAVGAAFEVAISKALDYKAAQREGGDFDVRGGKNLKLVQDLFGLSVPLADFKVSTSGDAKSSFYDKIRKEEGLKRGNIEQQKNRDQQDARKEALIQLRSSNPEWFTRKGDKLLDPKNFPGGPEAYKQANDRLNIRTERVLASYGGVGSSDALRSLATRRRFAFGYIPNFAAQQIADVMALETAMSGKKAIFDTKPFPHVRNKSQPTFGSAMADHGGKNRALKDSLMGQKSAGIIKASGFIPNFAVGSSDTEATGLAASVAAIGAQLGGLALMLSLNKDSLNSSLEEMIGKQKIATGMTVSDAKLRQQAIKEEITASQGNTQKIKRLQGEYDKLSGQISQTRNRGDVTTASTGQKIKAGIGANALPLAFIAPMIAETAANAIGKESKGARQGSALASGLGQTASFAATGFMVGGPWGAAIGGAIGAVTTFTSVIKEASTNLPELYATAEKSAQALSKVNESSQNILTAFNNLETLRDSGKTKEAGVVESNLFNEIQKTLSGRPELAVQAMSAIKSGDFESLSKALEENTKAILEKSIEDKKSVGMGTFAEEVSGIRGRNWSSGRGDAYTEEGRKKFQESLKKNVLDLSDLGTGQITGQKLQDLDTAINKVSGEDTRNLDVSKFFAGVGIDFDTFFEDMKLEGPAELSMAFDVLRTEINKRAQIERDSSADSEENNARLRAINQALKKAYSHYQQIAKEAASNSKLEFELGNLRRELSVEFGKTVLEGRSEVSKTLGVSSSGQRSISNEQKQLDIQETFDKTMADSLSQVQALTADFMSGVPAGQAAKIESGTTAEGQTQLEKAESRAKQVQNLASAFTNIPENIQKAMEKFGKDGNFDIAAFEQALQSGIDVNDPKSSESLKAILEKARETVGLAKKAEQTRKAQLAILAQQNMNQLAQEFAAATVAAFGGIQAEFLGKNASDKSFSDQVIEATSKRQSYVDALARDGQPLNEERRQELGRRSGNAYSEIEKMVGRPLSSGLEAGQRLILQEQEIAGRASQLTEQRQQIRAESGTDPAITQALNQADKLLAQQTGFGEDYNKIMQGAQNPTFEQQSEIEAAGGTEQWVEKSLNALFQKIFQKTAQVQSDELRKTGELDQSFFDAAKAALDPKQREALEAAGASGKELFKDYRPIQLQEQQIQKTDETNSILQQIRDALATPNANATAGFNFGSGPGQNPLPSFNTSVSPTININVNGNQGGQVNGEAMSAETAKVLEENKDRILAAGGLAEKVANLETTVYNKFPNDRPPPSFPGVPPLPPTYRN